MSSLNRASLSYGAINKSSLNRGSIALDISSEATITNAEWFVLANSLNSYDPDVDAETVYDALGTVTSGHADFYLGTNATSEGVTVEPQFTGTKGTNGAYFAMQNASPAGNPGRHFRGVSGTNTTKMNEMHKAGADFSFFIVWETPSSGPSSTTSGIFSTTSGTGSKGARLISNANESFTYQVTDGTSLVYNSTTAGTGLISTSTLYCLTLSVQEGTGISIWINGSENAIGSGSYSAASADDSTQRMRVGCYTSSGSFAMESGKVYGFGMLNNHVDSSGEATLRSELSTILGLSL